MKPILYLKADKNIEVKKMLVKLGDLFEVECTDSLLASKVKTLKLFSFEKDAQKSGTKKSRMVISVLKVIAVIHETFPDLMIQNLGEKDIIVTYEKQQAQNKMLELVKIGSVVLITFVGAAFSIMTFNNDVQLSTLFGQIHELVTGTSANGFSILELSYSLGLIGGILIFFNHFGKKRFSKDPTPIEVEMRLYENDIQTTIIETYARKGEEIGLD